MGSFLLVVAVLAGIGLLMLGGIRAGIADVDKKHASIGLILVGALIYGAAGVALWHWAVGLTTLVMFAVTAFAVFARKEWLNG